MDFAVTYELFIRIDLPSDVIYERQPIQEFTNADSEHYVISIGPFLGGHQPEGFAEPDGEWIWLSGEV